MARRTAPGAPMLATAPGYRGDSRHAILEQLEPHPAVAGWTSDRPVTRPKSVTWALCVPSESPPTRG
jgi:hypothetical protein